MAIEFNCPYCTATIRVADEFSGKRGSCPKCATKLLVPDIVPPSAMHPTTEPAALSIQPSPEFPLPNTPVSDEVPAFAPPAGAPTVSRSLRAKRRRGKSQRVFSMVIPVICFLAFLALLGVVYLMQQDDLKGTLRGNLAIDMEIPRATVSIAELGLSEADEKAAMTALEKNPESFVSAQMTCTIGLEGRSLTIDVRRGEGFSWFALNPGSNPTLAAWIRRYTIDLNTSRLKYASEAGADLCRDKILKAGGTPVVFDAERYRDGFGLNSHVGAFGFAVEAITKNHRTPCAHEDGNGTLYFSLPDGTTEMTLRGRSLAGGKPLFPGEYRVMLTPVGTAPQSPNTLDDADGGMPDSPEPVDSSEPMDSSEGMDGKEPMSDDTDPASPKMMTPENQ